MIKLYILNNWVKTRNFSHQKFTNENKIYNRHHYSKVVLISLLFKAEHDRRLKVNQAEKNVFQLEHLLIVISSLHMLKSLVVIFHHLFSQKLEFKLRQICSKI